MPASLGPNGTCKSTFMRVAHQDPTFTQVAHQGPDPLGAEADTTLHRIWRGALSSRGIRIPSLHWMAAAVEQLQYQTQQSHPLDSGSQQPHPLELDPKYCRPHCITYVGELHQASRGIRSPSLHLMCVVAATDSGAINKR